MSYTRTPRALGASAEDIAGALAKIVTYGAKLPQYANTIAEIIDDPYLPEVACRVDQIYDARKKYPIKACTNTPGSPASPLFQRAMPVIRGVAYAEQKPWVYPVFFGVLFGVPALVGYAIGKRR